MSRKPIAVNHEVMHRINRSLVLSTLRGNPSQTRAWISDRTGLTRSAISNLTDELIQNEMIHEVGLEESTGGRRGVLLELNPDGACAIAVKISVSSVQCALANLLGQVLWHKRTPLSSTEKTYVLNACEQLIQTAFEQNSGMRPVLGIGVVVAGVVDADGTVVVSTFMNWKNVNFRSAWERKYGVNVSVDNEVNLAAFGENHYGSAARNSTFIYIEIGHGAGAGIVIDDQLYRGTRGFAGEVGYMTVFDNEDNEVSSGQNWEALVNVPRFWSIVRRELKDGMTSSLSGEMQDSRALVAALHDGDSVAETAMAEMSRSLGVGIANLINILDITVIIIGGELGREYAPFLAQVHQEIDRHVVIKPMTGIDLRISSLQPDAALMGAVAQVIDESLRVPTLATDS